MGLIGYLAGSITTALTLGQPQYRDPRPDVEAALKDGRKVDPDLVKAVERWNDRARRT